jgi:hypothetical protein
MTDVKSPTKTIYIYVPFPKCKHFWHFMMGEFMPIVSIIAKTKASNVIIYNEERDWGDAFDKFYKDITTKSLRIKLVNASKLKKHPGIQKIIDLVKHYDITNYKWDWRWNTEDIKECNRAIRWLKKRSLKYMEDRANTSTRGIVSNNSNNTSNNTIKSTRKKEVIIQLRKDTQYLTTYFKKAKVGISNDYGAKRREVANLDKIPNIISKISDKNINSKSTSTDGLHIYAQVYPYINAKNIILGHGAGMVFTLFMKNKSNVVEIIPPDKVKELNGAAQGLKRIAKMKSFNLDRIILDNHKSILSIDIRSYIKDTFIPLIK